MKSMQKMIILTCCCVCAAAGYGQGKPVGAKQLLINPNTRTAAWADANIAGVEGLDAVYSNVAGLSNLQKTAFQYNRTSWLGQTGIRLNSFGLAQRVGDKSTLALTGSFMKFGFIQITTQPPGVDIPESIGPKNNNFNLAYAYQVSPAISIGINTKYISERFQDLRGTALAFDAGLQYVGGKNDQIKLGATVKNIGTDLRIGSSDDLFITANNDHDSLFGGGYQLPALMSLGGAYDFYFKKNQQLTAATTFTAYNNFANQFKIGFRYKKDWKHIHLNALLGYQMDKEILTSEPIDPAERIAFSGLTGGFAVDFIFGKKQHQLSFLYSYRQTRLFNGIHNIGLHFELN